jgi:hypothetical protein
MHSRVPAKRRRNAHGLIPGGCFVMADERAGGCTAEPSHNPPAQHDDGDGCDQPPDELHDERDDQQHEQELPEEWMATHPGGTDQSC